MSATNRGSTRVESDFYATPLSCIDNFLKHHKLKQGNILEPSAGNGNIIKSIRSNGYDNHITAIDIREENHNLSTNGADTIHISNFLNYPTHQFDNYKTIITNPPYSIAQEFIEHCFEIADESAEIIMLLRTAFLESKKRYEFWQKHPLNALYVLSQRPSFTGKGTDATSYSWFVWNNTNKQTIKVI